MGRQSDNVKRTAGETASHLHKDGKVLAKDLHDEVTDVVGSAYEGAYDYWRRTHAVHHATAGNLDKRGIGDVETLTVAEYRILLHRDPLSHVIQANQNGARLAGDGDLINPGRGPPSEASDHDNDHCSQQEGSRVI